MTTDHWLDVFNDAAQLAQHEDYDRAATRYGDVALRVEREPTVTPRFHHLLAMRRADVAGQLGRKDESQHHFSTAMRIAFEELEDMTLVLQTSRELLLMIRQWEDWDLLASTATRLVAFGRHHNQTVLVLEANWHMPYAWRTLGQLDKARAHAEAILDRMRELDVAEAIHEWEQFIASLQPQACPSASATSS